MRTWRQSVLLLVCQLVQTHGKGGRSPLKQTTTPTWSAISVLGLYLQEMKWCMCVLTYVWDHMQKHGCDLWRPTASQCAQGTPWLCSLHTRSQVGHHVYLAIVSFAHLHCRTYACLVTALSTEPSSPVCDTILEERAASLC